MSPLFLPATGTVRRYLAFFLALLLAATVLVIAGAAPARAAAEEAVIHGITYSVDTDELGAGATAIRYDGSAGSDVVIPRAVDVGGIEYAVTAIGIDAFGSKGLTSVTLPDSLITIGTFAFQRNRLTSVALPDSLVTLGDAAFAFNDQLTSATLPDGLGAIGALAFYENRLTSVTLPSNLVSIGDGAFALNSLTSVVIPAGVTTLEQGAFHTNQNLTQVRFTGPAPTTITWAGARYPSLGSAAGLTVTFPAQYLAQSPEEGYTTPEWLGYTTHPVYTVSFDTGGGAVIDPVSVTHGGLLASLPVPVREGYTFTGWYTSPELDTLVNSELPVTENLTLHAGWQRDSVPAVPVVPVWLSLLSGSLGSLALSSPVT